MNLSATSRGTAIAGNSTSRYSRWIYWVLFAAIAGPFGIVIHELGHFSVAHAFGFPDVVLHFGSVSDGAAEAGAPQWQQGIKAGAGPFVTLALLGICCGATVRFGARPWIVAPGFAIGIRSALVGLAYLSARLRGRAGTADLDELNFARALNLSMDAVMATSTALVLVCWIFLALSISPGDRLKLLMAAAAGTAVGVVLYVNWLGPWILP
jgi:hypothetical protein